MFEDYAATGTWGLGQSVGLHDAANRLKAKANSKCTPALHCPHQSAQPAREPAQPSTAAPALDLQINTQKISIRLLLLLSLST